MEPISNSEVSSAMDKIKRAAVNVSFVIAVCMSLFHVITAAGGALPTMQQRSVHLGFALMLVFLQKACEKKTRAVTFWVLAAVCVMTVVTTLYILKNWFDMAMFAAAPRQIELILGSFITIAVLYATYLRLGPAMPVIAGVFIAYAFLGSYMPQVISHRGYGLKRIVAQLLMSTEGIYGTVLGVSATYIFLFVLFGALLEYSGAAKFFIDLATALFGHKQGGSAKVATVSSCLFGMVSGSAVANVMAIGPLTVPMMQREKYTNRFAGAVLSVAGTGGQFMPPIMGAAAFIIAETLGIPYIEVALGALIPAVLYYAAIWFIIEIRSNHEKITPMKKEELPDWKKVLANGAYLSLPFILLVVFLAVVRWSPIRSGFWAIISMIVVSWFKKATRMGPKELFEAFKRGAFGSLDVAVVTATAGIVVGMLSMTGLGLKFSSLLLSLSGGNLIVLLVLTAVAGLILGMGMNTTSVYIILSVLVAPALVKMGVPALAAHLFVFYFGILSCITPPVALASFAAAGVAKDAPMPLGFAAWKIGLSGYILPFMFIFNQELLFQGSAISIVKATITGLIGIFALSCALEGHFRARLNLVSRVLLGGAAICLIDSGILTDFIGIGVVIGFLLPNYMKAKKAVCADI